MRSRSRPKPKRMIWESVTSVGQSYNYWGQVDYLTVDIRSKPLVIYRFEEYNTSIKVDVDSVSIHGSETGDETVVMMEANENKRHSMQGGIS